MAQGAAPVGSWQFASPDFPAGPADYDALAGIEEDNPFVAGPAVGGMHDPTSAAAGTTGLMHVNTGNETGTHPAARMAHWSNALDYRHGPLFWLMIATILYFGLIAVRVRTPVGGLRLGR